MSMEQGLRDHKFDASHKAASRAKALGVTGHQLEAAVLCVSMSQMTCIPLRVLLFVCSSSFCYLLPLALSPLACRLLMSSRSAFVWVDGEYETKCNPCKTQIHGDP
jgi:hypothetical protein